MATMIPDLDLSMIENDGERVAYEALRRLPAEFTVLYSYQFRTFTSGRADVDTQPDVLGEADFVVVHPSFGYLVTEVKMGKIGFASGQWYEEKNGRQEPMHKDPLAQVQKAMYGIRDRYKEVTQGRYFPLRYDFALWFPESRHVWGELPATLGEGNVFMEGDLEAPCEAVLRAFQKAPGRTDHEATAILINKVLAPRCRFFAGMDEQIDRYDRLSKKVLTEEQQRILDESELNKRQVFFGAAGTGKTFVAMEKARRLARSCKKVLLTCYNKNLSAYMRSQVGPEIECAGFHDFLESRLASVGRGIGKPPRGSAAEQEYYDVTLPTAGFDYFSDGPSESKFDAVLVDEGQDFSENWYTCLQSMLRDQVDGEFYVFADANQGIFGRNTDALRKLPISKQRLTRNLRNTQYISDWIGSFVEDGRLYPGIQGGMRVIERTWDTHKEEKKMIEDEIGRLVSQGIKPGRIVILSPNRQDKSSLQGMEKIKDWPLKEFREASGNCIRFATIRSFKGLEADIVFLIGLKEGKQTCTKADVYVGGSRARFLLYVFYCGTKPPSGIRAGVTGD